MPTRFALPKFGDGSIGWLGVQDYCAATPPGENGAGQTQSDRGLSLQQRRDQAGTRGSAASPAEPYSSATPRAEHRCEHFARGARQEPRIAISAVRSRRFNMGLKGRRDMIPTIAAPARAEAFVALANAPDA